MEQNQESLFGLSVDQAVKAHLAETARWGRFLGVVGIIFCCLFLLFGVYFLVSANAVDNSYREIYGESGSMGVSGVGTMMFVFYLVGAVIGFFPCLMLLQFSGKMKAALAANDQAQMTLSFQKLKVLFRFYGILTIIVLAFWVLGLVAGGAGFLMGS